jgi:hypothetical protein
MSNYIQPPNLDWMHAQQKSIKLLNNPVIQVFESLVEYVREFEASLDSEHEVGASLASFGSVVTFHIRQIGHAQPNVITFEGVTSEGNRVKLIQHVSQLNVLLMATKIQPNTEKKAIGFV